MVYHFIVLKLCFPSSQVITIDLRSTQFCGGLGVTLPENTDAGGKNKGADVPELPYVKILNRVLPRDIRVLDWAPVAEGFSARFDCQTRTYRYYFPRGLLDVAVMAAAAKRLVSLISSTVPENMEKSWNFIKQVKVLTKIIQFDHALSKLKTGFVSCFTRHKYCVLLYQVLKIS